EVFVEEVGDAHREQARDVGGALDSESAQSPRQLQLVDEVARTARPDTRRNRRQQRTEHVREAAEPRIPALVRVGVGLRELRDLLAASSGVVVGELQGATVAVRREVTALRI